MRHKLGLFSLLALYGLMSARVIDVFSAATDLGRHLRDGEFLLSSSAWQVLHTNFYSYTYPEAPFVDHHWLASLVFYVVWKWVGFAGLNAFYICIGAATFLIFFRIAQSAAGFPVSLALALFLMPLLSARISVRPDIFTFLLCAIFLWLLWRQYNSSRPPGWKSLLLVAGLQVLWVNLHSGFVFGPVFIGVFLLSEQIERRRRGHIQRWSIILLLTLAACLVNPSGIRGALYPFTLLSTTDFPTLENQPVISLAIRGVPIEFAAILVALCFLGLSFGFAAWKGRFSWPLFALAAIAAILTLLMYRNYPLLGFFALSIPAINIGFSNRGPDSQSAVPALMPAHGGGVQTRSPPARNTAVVVLAAVLAGFCLNGARLLKERDSIGLGLKPGRDAAAEFFQANKLEGPILNNFNIGGYLIYHLFPNHRVYIDSRPEAYPDDFLEYGYVRPLHEEPEWERILFQYHFNAMVFSWASDWEQGFLARRLLDSRWAVVFLDHTTVILLRRTERNQNVVSRFEIPRERLPLVVR